MILIQDLKGAEEFSVEHSMDGYEMRLRINARECQRLVSRADWKVGDILYEIKQGRGRFVIIEHLETLQIGNIVYRLPGHDFCSGCQTLHADLTFCQCFYEAADNRKKETITMPSQKKFWIVKKRPSAGADILPGNTYQNKLYKTKEEAERRAQNLAQDSGSGYLVLEVVGCFDVSRVNEIPVVG